MAIPPQFIKGKKDDKADDEKAKSNKKNKKGSKKNSDAKRAALIAQLRGGK